MAQDGVIIDDEASVLVDPLDRELAGLQNIADVLANLKIKSKAGLLTTDDRALLNQIQSAVINVGGNVARPDVQKYAVTRGSIPSES